MHPPFHPLGRDTLPGSPRLGAGARLIFCGDVVGQAGRRVLKALLPRLREEHSIDFAIANGENAAGGVGISPRTARALFDCGVDVVTTGNHVYRHREVHEYLDAEPRIVRPANYPASNPGRGWTVVERGGVRLGVVNLSGTYQLAAARSPFVEIEAVLPQLEGRADVVVVDIHAEATSEKVALGWYLDGRVLAVLGTHTHVATADARVLPSGTAYITDVGMTGSRDSVIGMKKEKAIERLVTMMPFRFEPATGDPWLNAVIVEADEHGRALSIQQILEPAPAA